jgi:hypothetical protein
MIKHVLQVAVISMLAVGCKKQAPVVDLGQADVDAVNALVPADLKSKLVFELGDVPKGEHGFKDDNFRGVLPKGWKAGFMPGNMKPADGDDFTSKTFGGKVAMTINSNCDGTCEAKDWAAVSDKVNFAQYASGKVRGKLIKDVKGQGTRTLVFENAPSVNANGGTMTATVNGQTTTSAVTTTSGDDNLVLVTAWWSDGSRQYYTCTVELGGPAKSLEPAFEKACGKIEVK